MALFRAGRGYDARLDVRDHSDLLDLLQGAKPNGALWPVLATRRSGKTWTLLALQNRLDRGAARYLKLDNEADRNTFYEDSPADCLLIDEPALTADARPLMKEAKQFVKRCAELHRQDIKVLVALTPGEWDALEHADRKTKQINRRDLRYLPPLKPEEADALARRAPWSAALALPDAWRRNPYLLELALEVAEAHREWHDDVARLLRVAIDESEDASRAYASFVFRHGLAEHQKGVLRDAARGRPAEGEHVQCLIRCGLLVKEGPRLRVADPVLAHELPPPLRIHHLSDLHAGDNNKEAQAVDVKVKGPLGERLGSGVGAGPVRDRYLEHVRSLAADGRAPHLVIMSGDLGEQGRDSFYEPLAAWFARLAERLVDHPDVAADAPRILLVGGNHDVDWTQTLGEAGTRQRHLPFAQAFDGYPHPHLEQSPDQRPLAWVDYPDFGLSVLLLGSAEFGGERVEDPEQQKLLAIIEDLRRQIAGAPTEEETAGLFERLARVDPGLVHHDDLRRAMDHTWLQPVRIAVLHHPVSPMPPTEVAHFAGLVNAGQVKEVLFERGFTLVLHGHMHTGWFAREQWQAPRGEWRTLHVASAPTLGSRETTEPHGFNEIELIREGTQYEILVRRIVRDGERWVSKAEMGYRL